VPDAGRQPERRPGAPAGRAGDGTGVSETARLADHAAISRLTDELLPALIAKLSTTQLGELEVREGEWHVRLRRPYGVGPGEGRRAGDRPSRAQPGHEGHGHGRAGVEGYRPARTAGAATATGGGTASSGGMAASGITAGSGAASAASNGANGPGGRSAASGHGGEADRLRRVVTSPAVGIFHPGPKATAGTKVRSGDSLGAVDVLGVRQDVLAPADGIVGSSLVEADTAVEYGQELMRLELTAAAEAR
jgi:biotin carboxyl carrier protein